MNLIERYLAKALIGHTLVVLMVLLMILGFSEFMIQLGKLDANYTLAKGALYTLLKLPVYAYEIFPIALLIGTLMGLGGMANHGELTVLRVTGWSIGRILSGALKAALILWLLMALMGEFVAPQAETYAKKVRGEALNEKISIGSAQDFWLKEDQRFIHVAQVISDRQLREVTLYELQQNQLTQKLTAQQADFSSKNQWVLQNGQAEEFAWQQQSWPGKADYPVLDYQKSDFSQQAVSLPIDPDMLQKLQVESRYLGVFDLLDYIQFLEANQLDAEAYKLAFWRKIAMPLSILGMIALVFPLIFGSQRQVSMGQRIFVGIMIGMGFHLLNQIFGNLAVVYQLPTFVGAFLPSSLLILVAYILFKRLR